MPYGLYISAEGAHAQSRRMEVISNNLANVETPGFKRDLAMFQARYAADVQNGQIMPNAGGAEDLGGGVWFRGTQTDYSTGQLKKTGVETDVAIMGDGFFVVEKDGQNYLTKAGNFMFNADGRLVTQKGETVMSEDGTPIEIAADLPWSVTADGAIQQGADKIFLAIERPKNVGDLSKVGENLFHPLAPTEPIDPFERNVRQGVLEMSGVKPTSEMLEMIETSRAFEANINMVKNHDAILNSLVNRVLKSS
ncbi:MAG: flagellar basal-body rod protein FlgF [Pirellulales bacterium]